VGLALGGVRRAKALGPTTVLVCPLIESVRMSFRTLSIDMNPFLYIKTLAVDEEKSETIVQGIRIN
jgi:hypothetical protein